MSSETTPVSAGQNEAPLSNEELAASIRELERNAAAHSAIRKFLQTILDFLKVPGVLHLTDEQRAELSRRLDELP